MPAWCVVRKRVFFWSRHSQRGIIPAARKPQCVKKLGKQLTHTLSPPARAQRPLVIQCPLIAPLEHVHALCEPA